MRYFVDIAYLGKNYHGWQKQPDAISVQEVVENALAIYFQHDVPIVGAGRTDTGVHAKQLIAHFDCAKQLDKVQFLYKLNKLLPKDVSVQDVYLVNNDAHARFDATLRTYNYLICTKKNPFLIDGALFIRKPLDVEAMNLASKILLDYKDFECFSKVKTDVKTFNCTISEAFWEIEHDVLTFTVTADRFLRNMVRAIVGTLIEIGQGKHSPEHMHTVIQSKNRGIAGKSVDAKGLYLTKVKYSAAIKV